MCAQEVMNIEEQCAEHFRFTRKAATEQIQNFCHGVYRTTGPPDHPTTGPPDHRTTSDFF